MERRTLDEIFSRYILEPDLDDIFVEGLFDKEVIKSCLDSVGVSSIIYEIDTVEIGSDILNKHSLTSGNKQRVQCLAYELESKSQEFSVTCFVDKDLDCWFGFRDHLYLKGSLYNCIESHFIDESFVRRLMISAGRSNISDFDGFFVSFIYVLKKLFSFRIADKEMGLNMSWVDFDKCLTFENSSVSLNEEQYVIKNLHKNGIIPRKDQFLQLADSFFNRMNDDFRYYIRGHDFVQLLASSINAFKGLKELRSAVSIERHIVMSAPNFPEIYSNLRV